MAETRACAVAATLLVVCGAASAVPYVPRYQVVTTPPFLGDDAAEPSVAFNPASRLGMFQSGIHTLRYTLPEYRTDDPLNPAGLPESCDTVWEDVTPPNGPTVTLDPIGVGDPVAKRYFASQLAVKSSALNFSDDDGETWTSSVGGSPGASGFDHPTVGWGPYVAGGVVQPRTDYPNAIYYCAQDSDESQDYPGQIRASPSSTAGYTNCSRSDDGGLSFLPPTTVFTTVDCGGLTGHVRAAPDGTVYLPNKNCYTTQGVGVSGDMGLTWILRRPPQSTPGTTDPSIALASDGTAYLCYANGDGHPRVAVSHDKGATWTRDVDLGAAVGVVNAVFPQGMAGDPDRAACGFLGTNTPGNADAEDFPGVWYAYIATTYDAGVTWSVTNVTPGDPVQGSGGICTQGLACSASNRNLLDFNDMTIDDQGRPVMAFADGCLDCTPDFTSGRSAKGSLARAVGGKSLYASRDRAEPHPPQAACLAGARDGGYASLGWRPPAYDGKAAVTGYRVYRSTSPTSIGTLVGSTRGTTFKDSGANPAVPEYYYTVTALNAAGASVHSNRVRLSLDAGTESVCAAPGLTILDDVEGDAADATAAHDVVRLSMSQPTLDDGAYRLFFHLKMVGLGSLPTDTTWPVHFCASPFPCTDPAAPYGASNQYYTVEMSTSAPASTATPAFRVRQPTAGGTTLDTRTLEAARAESAYTAGGLITIAVDAAQLGLQASAAGTDRLGPFWSEVTVGNVVGAAATMDAMPDAGVGAGAFVTRAVDSCDPNTVPVAVLAADKSSGVAPLAVAFDGSGSSADGPIAEYRFDFGDGSPPVTQAGATISHTYAATGTFHASLVVEDSRGAVSPVPATRIIRVGEVSSPRAGNTRLGGGGVVPASLLLLAILGAAWGRSRQRRY